MGLLDEAIREHLELKRRNGADPGEVAREQQEALGPLFPGKAAALDGDAEFRAEPLSGDPDEMAPAGSAPTQDPPVAADRVEVGPEDVLARTDSATTGQETVELDMQSVLDADADASTQSPSAGPALAAPAPDAVPPGPEADSLEWEMPTEEQGARDEPGAYRHEAGTPGEHWDGEESHERHEEGSDVARDLPGQERLSFE